MLLWLLVSISTVAGIVYFVVSGGNFHAEAPSKSSELFEFKGTAAATFDLCGPPRTPPTVVTMVHSEDLQGWLNVAATQFARLCPHIQVKLTAREDMKTMQGLLSGELQPNIWAPADELMLQYYEQLRSTESVRQAPALLGGRHELAVSPIVLLIWEDRLRVLSTILREEPSREGQWVRGLCPLVPRVPELTEMAPQAMRPGTWADWYAPLLSPTSTGTNDRKRVAARERATSRPVLPLRPPGDGLLPSFATIQSWGYVKLARPRPTRFAAGLAVLLLMANDYVLPREDGKATPLAGIAEESRETTSAQPSDGPARSFEHAWPQQRDAFRNWVRRCEAGIEQPLVSEQQLPVLLQSMGAARLDGVITYEQAALKVLEPLDAHPSDLSRLSLIYPNPTLVARHPAVLLYVEPAVQDAA